MEDTQAPRRILVSTLYTSVDVGGNGSGDEGVIRVTDSRATTGSDLRDSSNIFDRIAQWNPRGSSLSASKTDVGKVSMSMAIRHRLVGPKRLVRTSDASYFAVEALA